MGSPDEDKDEKPQHLVYLDAFWIDQTEVTNEMFARFVGQTGYETNAEKEGWGKVCADGSCNIEAANANWQYPNGLESSLEGLEKHPVVQVSWYDAKAYCEWARLRLPTEAEWEKAARGTDDGRKYPWKDQDVTAHRANFCDIHCFQDFREASIDDGYSRTARVGTYPNGASPYGALDMAGNVWEWTNDWYGIAYYDNAPEANPKGPLNGEHRVLRGGSWGDGASWLRTTIRGWEPPELPESQEFKGIYYGFRCAADP